MINPQHNTRFISFVQRSTLSALAVSIALFFTFPAIGAEYQYSYPVSGSTVPELLRDIRRNSQSPVGAFGYTELNTHVSWSAIVDGSGTCTIETVDFSYDITIYMPDWISKGTAKQCLQDNWDTVWYEIQVHEEQHRNLYRLLNVDDINQRISAIKPRKSCEVLKTAINAEIEKILDANDKLHDAFHAANRPPTLWDC